MIRVRAFIFAILMGAGAISLPAAANDIADAVSALPVAITDVRLVGEWTKKLPPAGSAETGNAETNADAEPITETGLYRTIVATDTANGGASRLFIQWLQNGETGPSLLRSIEIPELAELDVVIYDFTYETDDDGLALYLDTYAAASGVEDAYELFLRAPDDYIFQPISN